MELFRQLSEEEEIKFRKWARDNHTPGDEIKEGVWHPVVVEECRKMDLEVLEQINGD